METIKGRNTLDLEISHEPEPGKEYTKTASGEERFIINSYARGSVIAQNLTDDHIVVANMKTRHRHVVDREDAEKELHSTFYARGAAPIDEFIRGIERAVKTKKTRTKKREEIAKGTLSVDHVAQEMMRRLREYDSSEADEIMRKGKGSASLPVKFTKGIIPERSYISARGKNKGKSIVRTKETINFSTINGEMFVSMRLTDEIRWQKKTMIIAALPETAVSSLVGKPASAVIKHPISEMLGNVKSARNRRNFSYITFETLHDEKEMTVDPKEMAKAA